MEKAHLRCIRKLTRFSTRHINWVICLPQKAGQRPRGPRLFSLQQMLIIQGIHGAFCTNTADCFWLWINLFTAHSHGHILYGSYMALLHGTDQIYNSGLEVQGFPSRLGVFLFFSSGECDGSWGREVVWGVIDLPHFLWCQHSCGLAPLHWPLTSPSLLCMDCWHSLLFLAAQ